MMNDIRTFKAATMQEALDLVRQDMGTDAVILHTRQIARRRILPWRRSKEDVEITAGLGVNVRSPGKRKRSTARTNKTAQTTRPAVHAVSPPRSVSTTPVAALNAAGSGRSNLAVVSESRPSAPLDDPAAELATKLNTIQSMLENLGRTSHFSGTDEIPSELFHLYTDLIDSEVEDDLARDLIFRVKRNCTPAQLNDVDAAKAFLTRMVESEIRVCEPITPIPGKRKVVALVGPTGVGKTTTIAKLAANFRLRDGVKMGLVTVDTYRIAAVEQLRTYAEIIDLPMRVVTSPLEMRRALDELVGLDLVLIDTAGRSPRDDLQIQELKSLLSEADVSDVHLVLSMTSSLRSLEATVEKFAVVNTTSLIMTKLDEAAGMGALLSLSRKAGLPISYLTTGQDVPEDIEPALSSRAARLVLGEEKLFN